MLNIAAPETYGAFCITYARAIIRATRDLASPLVTDVAD